MEEDKQIDDRDETTETGSLPTSGDSENLTEKLAGLESMLADEREKVLRVRAEFENFRRRKDQEVDTFKAYANEKLILDFLPVLDSFDRAIESASTADASALVDGIQLIQKQFQSVFEKLGVQPIEAVNTKFDPNSHMAVSQEVAEGVESQTVIKEFQRGYRYNDRVIRPAMVVVAQ